MTKEKNDPSKSDIRVPWVKLADLTMAAYCPKRRISLRDKDMRRLIKSIEEVGLLYPICITDDGLIVDGHRRVAAMKHIGLDMIRAMVMSVKSPDEISRLYFEANDNKEPLDEKNT